MRSLVKHVSRRRSKRVARIVGPFVRGRTLDVGCWNGEVAQRLDVDHVVGLDVAAPPDPKIEVVLYDGQTIPFPDRSFDTVLCCLVLHHADEPDRLLDEMKRVGDHIVVLEDRFDSLVDRWSVLSLHALMVRALAMPYQRNGFCTDEDWRRRFASHGLRVVHGATHRGVVEWPLLRHRMYVLKGA